MTKQEWLDNDLSFFHVTQTSNIASILDIGLIKGDINPFGICVIRSCHEDILEYLCQMMLITTDELNFSVIKISPHKHRLQISEILDDGVIEVTNPLHNYIKRNYLRIEPEDIVHNFTTLTNNIKDLKVTEQQLLALGIIESLE